MDKIKEVMEMLGCSSPNEFAETVLAEKVEKIMSEGASKTATAKDKEDITRKLQGLGYLE